MQELPLRPIAAGMVFAEDVEPAKGLLIARGQEVTAGLLEQVRHFSVALAIREPVRMIAARGEPLPAEAVAA
jgi:hypothetical protein